MAAQEGSARTHKSGMPASGSSTVSRRMVCVIVLILLFLMRPGMVPWLHDSFVLTLFNIGRWIAVAASVVLYGRIVRIDPFGLLCLALGCLALASLLANDLSLYSFTEFWAPACAGGLLARALCQSYLRESLWAMLLVSSAVSIVNLVTVLVFPSGIPGLGLGMHYFFNGHRNQAIIAILPSIFASLMLDEVKGRSCSVRSVALAAIGLCQVLLAYSATSLVVLVMATAGAVLLVFKRVRRVLNIYTYLAAYAVVFLSVVVFRLQDIVGSSMLAALGKDVTFTGRTVIWDGAIREVLSVNPLLGCGYDSFWNGSAMVGSAHNMILEILVQGGFLGVVVFVALLLLTARNLYARSAARSVALVSLAIACFLLIGLTEQTRWVPFFFFLGLGYVLPSAEARCRGLRGRNDHDAAHAVFSKESGLL